MLSMYSYLDSTQSLKLILPSTTYKVWDFWICIYQHHVEDMLTYLGPRAAYFPPGLTPFDYAKTLPLIRTSLAKHPNFTALPVPLLGPLLSSMSCVL
jgi:hypothetical protein